jgi:hypothetical protein
MDPTEPNLASFDDPILRDAIRRTWGAERAPEHLRAQVMALTAQNPAAQFDPASAAAEAPAVITSLRPSIWHQPWIRYGFAAAAMVVVGFALASRLDNRPFSGPQIGAPVTFASTLSQPVAQGLVDSHDRCSTYPNHDAYPELSPGNYEAIRRRLQDQLGFPVIAGPIEEALDRGGWRFRGAAVCKVGDVPAAHLVFVRNGQAISVFSLPRSCCKTSVAESQACEDANPDHPSALFVWSNGVHCVVGSSDDRSLSVDEVRSVLEHLRPTVAGNGPAPR